MSKDSENFEANIGCLFLLVPLAAVVTIAWFAAKGLIGLLL